jgi:hypothetical protein
VVPLIVPNTAVIVVLPLLRLDANPEVLMVATAGAEEVQVTALVRFLVLASVYVPVAVNCLLLPSGVKVDGGVTAIETKVGDSPVPLSDTFCQPFVAFPLKVRVPVRVPVACGEKATEEAQLEPPASVFGLIGQVEVTTKSLRLVVILEIVSGDAWLLLSVTDCVWLVVPFA